MVRACLRYANLSHAQVSGAVFDGADLTRARAGHPITGPAALLVKIPV
ncbi:MAG: pentapeptide repeat-containing protein [Pseudomonadota bacterium]